MKRAFKFTFLVLFFLALGLLTLFYLQENSIAILEPKGLIALKQKKLLVISTVLMLIIVVPVFILALIIAWRYRAENTKASYAPNWDYDRVVESIWWGIPCLIVAILGVITWKSCHELDPFKPLDTAKKPVKIQVVALQWRWLFIYPEYKIATLNYIQFPEQTPIDFEITADAPMNSFWIPQLGGQVYAMAGMKTQLHLIASEVGTFRGSSANLSGEGFAGMTFKAVASSSEEFATWIRSVQRSGNVLSWESYTKIAQPSEDPTATFYVINSENLYEKVITQYMPSETKRE